MSIQIKLKNSVVQDSTPSASDLPEVGELAVNGNINSIGGFMRASDNTIVKIFGPGSVTTPTATTTVSGISELATNSETTTGTATNRVVTPAGLNAVTVAERTTSNTNYVAKAGSTMTGALLVTNGSTSANSISPSGDANTGFNFGTDTVNICTGGSNRLTVNSAGETVTTSNLLIDGDGIRLKLGDAQDFQLYHTGSTNKIESFVGDIELLAPTSKAVLFGINSAEKARIDSSGRLLVGHSSSLNVASSTGGLLQVSRTTADVHQSLNLFKADNAGSILAFGKSRSATIGSYTVVQDDDQLGVIRFAGADGTDLQSQAASISAEVDGTPGANDMPGRLVFSTTADGAASPTTRLTINSAGLATFTGNVDCSAGLDVTGAITGTGDLTIDTNTLRVDSTNNRVGILTTAPNEALEVAGNCRLSSGGATRTLHMGPASAGIEYNVNGTTFIQGRTDAYPLAFKTQSAERMRIDSSGRLLYGLTSSTRETSLILQGNSNSYTTNPGTLEVRIGQVPSAQTTLGQINFGCTGDKIGGTISAIADNADWSSGSSHPTAIRFFTTPVSSTTQAERMRIDSSGQMLLGATSAVGNGTKIEARDDGNSTQGRIMANGFIARDNYGSATNITNGMYSPNSNTLAFATNSSEALRIDSSGNVGIGITSPDTLLHAKVNTFSDDINKVALTLSNNQSSGVHQYFQNASTGTGVSNGARIGLGNTDNFLIQHFEAKDIQISTNGSEAMRIDSSGRLLIGTSTARAVGGESNPRLHIEGSGNTSNSWVNLTRFQAGTGSANLQFAKARSNTAGTYTVVQDGDNLGQISFLGADGTDMANYAAMIKAQVDGTPGSNDMPGRLGFFTTADGGTFPTERMRIDSSGNVLIGSTTTAISGGKGLMIADAAGARIKLCDSDLGVTATDGFELIASNNGTAYVWNRENTDLLFGTNNAERMRIDSSGNVGIGTSTIGNESEHKKLIISGASGTGAGILEFQDTSNNTDAALFSDDGNLFIVADRDNTTSSSSIRFRVDGSSEKMRIDSSGRVGVGTSSPQTNVHISNSFGAPTGGIDSNIALLLSHTSAGNSLGFGMLSATNGVCFIHLGDTGNADQGAIVYNNNDDSLSFNANATTRLTIDSSGNIGAPSGTNIYNASDVRLKKNVVDLDKGLSAIKSLRPVSFNWIDGFCDKEKDTLYGFIAQEVETVDRNLIQEFGNGSVTVEGQTINDALRVNEKFIIPMLVKAIQELEAKVAALEGA